MLAGINEGNGKAKISFIGLSKPEKTTTKLNNVRYIKDCIKGNNLNTANAWIELQAIKNGINIAKGKKVSGTTAYYANDYSIITNGNISSGFAQSYTNGKQCITIDLGDIYDLDEIAVWHYFADRRTYNDNIIFVSKNNTNWIEVIKKNEIETSNGKRIGDYEK